MSTQGHPVDIITRQVIDDDWPEFADPLASYPGYNDVRIIRIPCGPKHFLAKEALWPYLGTQWVPEILNFYQAEGNLPDCCTTHYWRWRSGRGYSEGKFRPAIYVYRPFAGCAKDGQAPGYAGHVA